MDSGIYFVVLNPSCFLFWLRFGSLTLLSENQPINQYMERAV